MSHSECRHLLLSQSDVGHVSICAGCGQVHVSLQFITLRLEPEAFRAMGNLLTEGQLRMDTLPRGVIEGVAAKPNGELH